MIKSLLFTFVICTLVSVQTQENAIDTKDKGGNTALILAAHKGHKEVVSALIEHGADINAQNKAGETALMCAVYRGHKEVLNILIQHGADFN